MPVLVFFRSFDPTTRVFRSLFMTFEFFHLLVHNPCSRNSLRDGITQEGRLPALQRTVPTAAQDKNPFSPKNSPPTDSGPVEIPPAANNPLSAPAPISRKSLTSSENPFLPKAVSPPEVVPKDSRASQNSKPSSPLATVPPVTVGANNPFGDDAGEFCPGCLIEVCLLKFQHPSSGFC